jgi:hypothetical protein
MMHDPSSFRWILVPLDGSPFAEQAVITDCATLG